jgi:hypothetical protein
MVDFAQLRDARFDALLHAGDAYDSLSTAFGAHVADVESVGTACRQGWSGQAAFMATAALSSQHAELEAAHSEMLGIGTLLHEAAAAFAQAQAQLLGALEAARAQQCTVAEDGTVTGPPLTSTGSGSADAQAAQAQSQLVQAAAQRITDALQAAAQVDAQYAARLDALAAHALDGSGLTAATSAADLKNQFPPSGASPAAVKAWWSGLSLAEQQSFIHDQPGVIGNWDGIPVVARDQANRLNLPNLIAQYQQMPQPLSDIDQRKLDGFLAIQTRLEQDRGLTPPEFLIGLNDQGQGLGILSFGNPDTATNICSYVPGMGTTLSTVGSGGADSAKALWTTATNQGAGSVASIVWVGYDPPPGPLDGDPAAVEAGGDSRARSGAVSYDQFMTGLRATHDGPQPHLTALGHSYGSLTVGLAGQLPGGTHADDVILIGSPGVEASHASQLGVPAGHVWVGAARNDPVTHLPSKFDASIGAANPLLTLTDPNTLWYGTDPASGSFGANRFQVAPGAMSFATHSKYLTPGSDSMNNIAAIVAPGGPTPPQLVAPR